VQVAVLPVTAEQEDAAAGFVRAGIEAGLRVEASAGASLASRIRRCAKRRVPYIAVIGDREAARGEVALRMRDGRGLPSMPVAEALRLVADAVASHRCG
jgi:threonyl-tRNA synthetase